jgi:hypothetical protein
MPTVNARTKANAGTKAKATADPSIPLGMTELLVRVLPEKAS